MEEDPQSTTTTSSSDKVEEKINVAVPAEEPSPEAPEEDERPGEVAAEAAGGISDSPSKTPDNNTPTNTSLPSETFVSNSAIRDKEKINIRLNPVGDAPILKQKLWAVPADREVGQIIEFVKKYLKLEKHQSLFVFINQAFAPSPDQQLRELYECFGSDGKITLHYSTTYAWG